MKHDTSTAGPAPGLAALFLGFLNLGFISFGGALPHARRIVVENRRWLTPAEFTDLLGLHYWFKRIGLNRQLLGGPERVRHLAAQMQGFAA